MSHAQSHASEVVHKPHVLNVRVYLAVWAALLVLTVITVYVSYFDFGTFNVIVAMTVASLKASLVVLFFMHLKYDEHFNVLVFVSSLAFLSLFFIFTLSDTMRRGELEPRERGTIQVLPALPGADHGAAGGGEHGAAAAEGDSAAAASDSTAAPAGGHQAPPAGAPASGEPAPSSSGTGH